MRVNEWQDINGYMDEVEASDLNLDSFRVHDELQPDIWINGKINSEVRKRLLEIAHDFYDDLEIRWARPLDVLITGSIANYNWSEYSDIDLHLLLKFSDVHEDTELLEDYFKAKKDLWNNDHSNLTIYGFPVEVYMEDTADPPKSAGKFSLLKNKWLEMPKDLSDAKLNEDFIKEEAAKIMTKIDDLADSEEDPKVVYNKCHRLFEYMKDIRKKGLETPSAEMSSGNIIWKVLRREGYIEHRADIMVDAYDRINSIDKVDTIKESMERLLSEAATDRLFHYINIDDAITMLKNNRLRTSDPEKYMDDDLEWQYMDKGNRYISLTRNKNTYEGFPVLSYGGEGSNGVHGDIVRIEFDGWALNTYNNFKVKRGKKTKTKNFKVKPMDWSYQFFGRGKGDIMAMADEIGHHVHNGKEWMMQSDDHTTFRWGGNETLSDKENHPMSQAEDRLTTSEKYIPDVKKYIKVIDVYFEPEMADTSPKTGKRKIERLCWFANKLGIPVHLYTNFDQFAHQSHEYWGTTKDIIYCLNHYC